MKYVISFYDTVFEHSQRSFLDFQSLSYSGGQSRFCASIRRWIPMKRLHADASTSWLNIQSENRNFVQVTSACNHHTPGITHYVQRRIISKLSDVSSSQNQQTSYNIWPGTHAHRVSFHMTVDEQANRRHFVGIESFQCIRTSRIEKHACLIFFQKQLQTVRLSKYRKCL